MKTILFFLAMILFCFNITAQNWEQLGNEINGLNMDDYFGTKASLSSDGSTLAVGAPYNDENGNKSGQIRVFNFDGTSWSQKGNNINGVTNFDNTTLVELSADGATVAVGSDGNYSLKARVFDYDGSDWILRGSPISGPDGELAGGDMSLSADGNRIILSYPGNSSFTGRISIYEWNGTSWNQLGLDINGNAAGDKFGRHVKFNTDGNTFITGTEYFPNPTDLYGQIRVYDYNGSAWIQRGNNIAGNQQYAALGSSVDISDDGNTIIAGEPGFTNSGSRVGRTRVFVWNGTEWMPKGSDIEGVSDRDKTGAVVTINSTGNVMATKGLGGGGSEQGNVRMFQFNGSDWMQLGQTIVGGNGDTIGYGLDFSNTGNIISIGNPLKNTSSGQVKIYRFDGTIGITENKITDISIFPNPSSGNFTIDLGKEYTDVSVQISNILGQTISSEKYALAKIIAQEINASAGIYFVKVGTAKGESNTLRIIKQ